MPGGQNVEQTSAWVNQSWGIFRSSYLPSLLFRYFVNSPQSMGYERRRSPRSNSSDSTSCYDPPRSPSRPSRPATNSWRQHDKWQFVWPNDKRRSVWGRWKDIFTDKGPDIFIAEQNTPQPERPIWSNWKTQGRQHPNSDNVRWTDDGNYFRQDEELFGVRGCQHRDHDIKYDFATRRYRRPNDNVWSGVKWSKNKPYVPCQIRRADGSYEYPAH